MAGTGLAVEKGEYRLVTCSICGHVWLALFLDGLDTWANGIIECVECKHKAGEVDEDEECV